MEFKNYDFEVKSLDTKKGEILLKHAGWNVDRGNDEIDRAAFDEQYKSIVPKDVLFLLNHHDDQKIGEVKQLYTNNEGAFTVAQFGKDALGLAAMEMTERKLVAGVSLGYVAERKEFVSQGSKRIRRIKKIRHGETSLLVGKEPMNPEAGIVDVKSFVNDRREYIHNLETFCRTSRKAPDSLLRQLQVEVKEMKRQLDEYTYDDWMNDLESLERRLEAERKDIHRLRFQNLTNQIKRML